MYILFGNATVWVVEYFKTDHSSFFVFLYYFQSISLSESHDITP